MKTVTGKGIDDLKNKSLMLRVKKKRKEIIIVKQVLLITQERLKMII